jgi:ABC-type lipoprotein release transport system permease subunit
VLGAGGVLLLRRAFESQLYEVSPLDPVVVSAVATVLLVVASLASALPARRAASTNPNTALVDQ